MGASGGRLGGASDSRRLRSRRRLPWPADAPIRRNARLGESATQCILGIRGARLTPRPVRDARGWAGEGRNVAAAASASRMYVSPGSGACVPCARRPFGRVDRRATADTRRKSVPSIITLTTSSARNSFKRVQVTGFICSVLASLKGSSIPRVLI